MKTEVEGPVRADRERLRAEVTQLRFNERTRPLVAAIFKPTYGGRGSFERTYDVYGAAQVEDLGGEARRKLIAEISDIHDPALRDFQIGTILAEMRELRDEDGYFDEFKPLLELSSPEKRMELLSRSALLPTTSFDWVKELGGEIRRREERARENPEIPHEDRFLSNGTIHLFLKAHHVTKLKVLAIERTIALAEELPHGAEEISVTDCRDIYEQWEMASDGRERSALFTLMGVFRP